MIHVCFGMHDANVKYSNFVGTTMASIFENTSTEVTIHILHDSTLTDDNRDKFSWLAGKYNQHVKFYNVDELCPDEMKFLRETVDEKNPLLGGVGMFYRLLISKVFDGDKIIYLDADIVVNLDIAQLWRIDLGDKVLGVIPEILSEVNGVEGMKKLFPLCRDGLAAVNDYFNSGVLLINVARLRNETQTVIRGFEVTMQNPDHCSYPDQDLLNYCFATESVKLPTTFDCFVRNARWDGELPQKKIYHYSGSSYGLGLGLDAKDPFNRLWLEYFAKTPWFDAQTIGRLFDEFQRRQDALKRQLIDLSSTLVRRKRVFFAPQENLMAIADIFAIQGDEEVIIADAEEADVTLLGAMKRFRGQKIFFIMLQDSAALRNFLTRQGFVPNEDFVDGFEFFTEDHGVKFNSYPFVKAI
ncbi:MAG: hypothetical protein IJ774_04245 [Selenomonadaceae bacterium]|nr:hypothetical protein [Selenomonadaceae bacterium]